MKIPIDTNRLLNLYGVGSEYKFVKFEVNSEAVKCTSHTIAELKSDVKSFSNHLIFPIPHLSRTMPSGGKVICNKITSIAIGHFVIMLHDKDKNSLIFNGHDPFQNIDSGFEDNWTRLIKQLEIHLFPHLVDNIVKEIMENGEFEICKSYRLKATMNGISLEGKFINLENISCKIDFKNWEIKISNKKNIFQGRKISTFGFISDNIIILPYLIDYLNIIHHQ